MQKYDPPYDACPICWAANLSTIHRDFRGNDIVKCARCTVQFMSPVYSDEHLAAHYAGYYGGGVGDADVVAGQLRTNDVKLRYIQRFIRTPGRVLDFGCGNGNFAHAARDRGWQVTGYDIDCDAMQKVAARLGMPVKCGSLAAVDWQNEVYDLIHAHHVLEHLKHPVHDLGILHDRLKKGGYLYIGVPNIHALSARLKYFAEKLGLKRRNAGKYYDSDHHVFFYTPLSMKNLLSRCGFDVLLTMNGSKAHLADSALAQFFLYQLPNYLYASSSFFVIARKP